MCRALLKKDLGNHPWQNLKKPWMFAREKDHHFKGRREIGTH
jgi:hypothetical protein